MKKNLLSLVVVLVASACSASKDEPNPVSPPVEGGDANVTEVINIKSDISLFLSTDKACYKPGESVKFKISENPSGVKIRYRKGAEVIKEEPLSSGEWSWTPPSDDFQGYLVEIYKTVEEGKEEMILGTIAVDVSSDWTRFPRYGFVADFDASKLQSGVIEAEMDYLNRCHINGVQFQDWHYKHHWPMPGSREETLDSYLDIANRTLSSEAVKKYIDVQHGLGMKSIFYNLCFGALDDAAADGVKEEWYAYHNRNHGDKDRHSLPSSWKSDIFVLDPGNTEWQAYLAERNDEVYSNFNFDGYQIDQLGYRGEIYDYNGQPLNLPKGYASFIDAMKTAHPDKRLIMNAVSSYGASQIVGSGKVDFCYNELWNDEAGFSNLHDVIAANDAYSGNTLKTVFAAYMNYDKAGRESGYFNNPGVLMTDAVMMAIGGSHLELGDHMLSREYFPASPLAMDDDLKNAMIRYYDFMTAYQNILRGTTTKDEFDADIKCTDASKNLKLNVWPPKEKSITSYSRKDGNRKIVHLLNFRNQEDMSWRDLNGTRPAPRLTTEIPFTMTVEGKVNRIWTASPDRHAGAVEALSFTQTGNTVSFTLPSLLYWSMIVIE